MLNCRITTWEQQQGVPVSFFPAEQLSSSESHDRTSWLWRTIARSGLPFILRRKRLKKNTKKKLRREKLMFGMCMNYIILNTGRRWETVFVKMKQQNSTKYRRKMSRTVYILATYWAHMLARLVRVDKRAKMTRRMLEVRFAKDLWMHNMSNLKTGGYNSRPHWMLLLIGKNKKPRLQFTIECWKNVVWSDESQFLLQYSESRVRIWWEK